VGAFTAETPGHDRLGARVHGVGIGFTFDETRIGRHAAVPSPPPESEHAWYAPGEPSLVELLHLRRPEDSVAKLTSPTGACSGALVDPEVILTAAHCVENRVRPRDIAVAFEPDGVPVTLRGVRSIVLPRCAHPFEGGGDIAALVLDARIEGIPPLRVQRDRPPEMGAVWTAIGYGSSKRAHVHAAGTVAAVTPTASLLYAWAERGDSGGPALDMMSGDLVGIVSRGNGWATSLTRVDVFGDVLERARTAARTRDPSEELSAQCAPDPA
jgi:hypothetical protein